jgi:hypothetical protein
LATDFLCNYGLKNPSICPIMNIQSTNLMAVELDFDIE